MAYEVVAPAVFAFALTLGATPLARLLAFRVGAVATPRADRWHRTQIPMLGGLAIASAVVLTTLAVRAGSTSSWILLAGAGTLCAVGLVDDLRPLRPQSKLLAQIVVACALAALGLRLRLTGTEVPDLLLTVAWIVGITNAFNLLDNMDGLAAGIGAIAVGFRLAFLVMDGNHAEAALAATVLGALLGFLVFNFNPASIFMGDAGSLFLGTMVAGLSMVGGWPYSRGVVSVLLLPVLLSLVPIFDTVLVTIARTLAGRRISVGGRDHTSHRLVALGMSERRAVVLLYGVALASGAVGFVSLRYGLSRAVSLVGVLAIGVALLGVYLGRLKVYAEGDVPPPESRIVTLFSDFAYKRQVAAVAIDLVLVVLAYYTSYMLRFEDRFDAELPVFVQSLPVVIICQMAAFAVFGVYQSMWRYTGMREVLRLAQAVTVGTTAAVLVLLFLHRFFGYSRAVFVIDWIVLVGAATMARLSFRALQEVLGADTSGADPVIVYGAGNGGAMVLREIRGNQALGLRVAAFLDDDRSKSRTSIGGVPVAGGIESLKDAITKYQPTQLIFSTDKVSPDRLARVTALCEEHGIIVRRARIRFE